MCHAQLDTGEEAGKEQQTDVPAFHRIGAHGILLLTSSLTALIFSHLLRFSNLKFL